MTMTRWCRTFTVAAVLVMTAAAGVATGQTVSVARATPGSTFELALNGAKIGSAAADAGGVASVDVDLAAHGGKNETDVRLAIDTCGNVLRVQLLETGLQFPPAAADCARNEIAGIYVMRRITSFVVDVGTSAPSVWLFQGPAPKTWLHPELVPESGTERVWRPMPTGLILSAGGGFGMFSNVVTAACGDAPTCNGSARSGSLNAAATYWFTRSLGLSASFLKPSDLAISGSGTNFTFANTLQTRLLMLVAKVGIPAGPTRVYGVGGLAHHWVVSTTSNTIGSGTQTFGMSAPAWEWVAGGGIEIAIRGPIAVYAEGGYAPLKTPDKAGGEAQIDDRIIYAVGGIQIHLWR